jgi:hypothetical protein
LDNPKVKYQKQNRRSRFREWRIWAEARPAGANAQDFRMAAVSGDDAGCAVRNTGYA